MIRPRIMSGDLDLEGAIAILGRVSLLPWHELRFNKSQSP